MAGLLDYLNKGGNFISSIMDGLSTPGVAGDPALLEMMTPEQREAAKKQARIAGVAAMQGAAAQGAPWYALGAARDSAGQGAYDSYMKNAVASVEELRKRRDSDARRKSIAALVDRLSNPEDPLTKEFTPEQLAVLASLDPDSQAEMLMKTAFPKQSGLSTATAGTVQGGRFKLQNGNIGALIQTGDPKNPVEIVDTGQKYVSEAPSSIRELQMMSPELMAVLMAKEQAGATGAETGKANVAALKELPALVATNERHVTELQRLEQEIAGLPTGPISGRVLDKLSSNFQVAQAMMYEEALLQIGALKAAGASLNPITERELEILFTTSPKLTNNRDANVRIIRSRIEKIKRVNNDLRQQIAAARAGDVTRYDPSAPPPAPAPGPRAAPAGGAAPASSIPTIQR